MRPIYPLNDTKPMLLDLSRYNVTASMKVVPLRWPGRTFVSKNFRSIKA
jgi:hypothetical protein